MGMAEPKRENEKIAAVVVGSLAGVLAAYLMTARYVLESNYEKITYIIAGVFGISFTLWFMLKKKEIKLKEGTAEKLEKLTALVMIISFVTFLTLLAS